jgi:hypothetical protein
MYSSKKVLGVYFVKYFYIKNAIFGHFKVNKCRKPAIWRHCCTFLAAWKAYLTPSTTTASQGTPSANSRRTKQFFSHPHSL